MRDILDDVERWISEGKPVATATVLETWGSAPRAAGGKMAVTADGGISGSVSGGCVENAVVEAARQTIANGVPQRLRFGIADDTAWGVGLACGGSIEVFVERLRTDLFPALRDALRAERRAAVATVVAGTSDRLGKKATRVPSRRRRRAARWRTAHRVGSSPAARRSSWTSSRRPRS